MKATAAPTTSGWFCLKGWVFVCAAASALGWSLAAIGALDRIGYTVGALLIGIVWWIRGKPAAGLPSFRVRRRRWKRPLPLIYAALLLCALAGGILYPPNNYDALTYRLPQILHWLDQGRWHWISTSEPSMNVAAAGQGWLMAPWIVWLQNDRGLFLSSLAAFALLPGAFFSVLRSSGIGGRVAWTWMWILPSASCYALQAGGLANDLLVTVFWLVAFAFGLRARRWGRVEDFWFSLVSAALATGVKWSAAPLVIPWFIVTLPCWKGALRIPTTAIVLLAGVLVSAAPTAGLNLLHTGHLGGDPGDRLQVRPTHPIAGLTGNAIELLVDGLAPPLFPAPGLINRPLAHFADHGAGLWIREHFPRFNPQWSEMASEESSGLGLGITLLAAASALAAGFRRSEPQEKGTMTWWLICGGVGAWVVFAVTLGSEAAGRLSAPYYPLLLLPALRHSRLTAIYHHRLWRFCGVGVAASVLPAVLLTPARPLWPAVQIVTEASTRHPDQPALARAAQVYATYASRHDFLAPLKPFIPAGTRAIGFVPTINDLEAPLWKPYGHWRVVEVTTASKDDPVIASLRGSIVLTSDRGLKDRFNLTPDDFAAAVGGRIVATRSLCQKARIGPEAWHAIAIE